MRKSPDTETWLYMLERVNPDPYHGRLKIGVTSNPRARMREHGKRREAGAIVWRRFMARGPRVLILEIERVAIRALAQVGVQKHPTMGEEFDGIEREAGVLIVRRVVETVRENFRDYAACKARYQGEQAAWQAFRTRLSSLPEVV